MRIQSADRAGVISTVLFLSALLAWTGVACGIEYGSASQETEVFKSMTLDGVFTPHSQITMLLDYEQPYPVDIRLRCNILSTTPLATHTPEFGTPTATPISFTSPEPTTIRIPKVHPTPKYRVIGIDVRDIPPNPDAKDNPDATPVHDTMEVQFFAPAHPGDYFVRCYTPADPDNAIAEPFTVVEGPAALPTQVETPAD